MKKMSMREIGQLLGETVIGQGTVTGVSVDTRFVKPGDLFVCLVGERVDGHDFAKEAIGKGAMGLLVSRELDLDIPQILVPDTLQGLFDFAKAYRKSLNLHAIGITGSNGKTSTKDILNAILSLVGPTIATHENQNTEIGSCLTLFRADETTRYGIFEMGLDAPGEIGRMVKLIKPTSAIVTGLDEAHIDNFNHDLDVLAKEKFSIFNLIDDKSHCFYQGDVENYRKLAQGHQSFGFNLDNDFVIEDVSVDSEYTYFKIKGRSYQTNLLGEHQASNAGGVVSLLRFLGISDDKIKAGLKEVKLSSMRTEIYDYKYAKILFDAYKASPKSMASALSLFESYPYEGDRILVLADMYMLGENAYQLHKEVLQMALKQSVKHVFLLGDEFGGVMHEFEDNRMRHYEDLNSLKQALKPFYETANFILFKGSRYYTLEKLLKED